MIKRNKLGQFLKGIIPANKKEMVDISCQYCGKIFQVHPCRENTAKYCSHYCSGMGIRKCGENSYMWKGGEKEVKCFFCGESIKRKPSELKKYKKSFCGKECLSKYQRTIKGEKHPNWGKKRLDMMGVNNPSWNGGTSFLDKSRHSDPKYIDWRKTVFSRDNYTCQGCGRYNGYLEAHHIKPWRDYPELRYEVDNGITYCLQCHARIDNFRKLPLITNLGDK